MGTTPVPEGGCRARPRPAPTPSLEGTRKEIADGGGVKRSGPEGLGRESETGKGWCRGSRLWSPESRGREVPVPGASPDPDKGSVFTGKILKDRGSGYPYTLLRSPVVIVT